SFTCAPSGDVGFAAHGNRGAIGEELDGQGVDVDVCDAAVLFRAGRVDNEDPAGPVAQVVVDGPQRRRCRLDVPVRLRRRSGRARWPLRARVALVALRSADAVGNRRPVAVGADDDGGHRTVPTRRCAGPSIRTFVDPVSLVAMNRHHPAPQSRSTLVVAAGTITLTMPWSIEMNGVRSRTCSPVSRRSTVAVASVMVTSVSTSHSTVNSRSPP